MIDFNNNGNIDAHDIGVAHAMGLLDEDNKKGGGGRPPKKSSGGGCLFFALVILVICALCGIGMPH